jgi:hypothetical protein
MEAWEINNLNDMRSE